jgi:hypothetical protein
MPCMRLNWSYDPESQTFTTPSGVVSLLELANCRYSMMTSWSGHGVAGECAARSYSHQAEADCRH